MRFEEQCKEKSVRCLLCSGRSGRCFVVRFRSDSVSRRTVMGLKWTATGDFLPLTALVWKSLVYERSRCLLG